LGLAIDATGDDVRAAFRRLAIQYHPDLNRSPASTRRFVELVKAYRALQIEMGLRPNMAHYRRCPRCGRYGELLEGLDRRPGCADCLLGITARRHFLPPLTFATVKHIGTIALYAASVISVVMYAASGGRQFLALSLGCAFLGLFLLFVTCMTVPEFIPRARRWSPHTDWLFVAFLVCALALGFSLMFVGLSES
jgi:uncharacterized protein (DUF983 family)